MKLLKYLGITLGALIALILIIALFVPRSFHAEGQVTINQPQEIVYDYVKYLKTQEAYSVWFKMDSNIVKHYSGTDGTVGSQIIWESKEVGDGKQVIINLVPYSKVVIDLHLMNPDNDPAHYVYDLAPIADNQTAVKIYVDGNTPYPMNIMSLFFDMNAAFQETAQNLKQELEKK